MKKKLKVISIIGTRPEAIKMAPVLLELQKQSEFIDYKILATAQHREMLDQVFKFFGIEPHFDLNIMKQRQTLVDITIKALRGITTILREYKPDIVLVQGDTTTVFAGSLAAFYLKIPVGHIEAGLRTNSKYLPFPEELNRRVTGVIAELHFAPTERARSNLLQSGVPEDSIYVTGNTVIDAVYFLDKFLSNDVELPCKIKSNSKVLFVEAHRRENWGKPLTKICKGIRRIVKEFPDVEVVFPVHRNPLVRKTVYAHLSNHPRIHLIEPLDYLRLISLQKKCYLILTDSGGIQEEAPLMRKPVLVLRTETERPEGIEAGCAKLVGVEEEKIFKETALLLLHKELYESMARGINPYGDGKASRRIVEAILYYFNIQKSKPDEFVFTFKKQIYD